MAYKFVANLKNGAYFVAALTPKMVKDYSTADEICHTIITPDGKDAGFNVIDKTLNELIKIIEKPGYKWFIEEYDEAVESWCEKKKYADELFS